MQQIDILESHDYATLIHQIPTIVTQLEQLKTHQHHKTYLIKKIEELRQILQVINDLLDKDEVIHSPKRQVSKNKKSRILFDRQLDQQILKSSITKLQSQIKILLRRHKELHQKFQLIENNLECSDTMLIQLDITRLAMIYQSELEYVNEYFNNIENNPNNLNTSALDTLIQSYQSIIQDQKLQIIVQYYINLNQLIDDLQNLNTKLNQYEELEYQSTNAENSRQSSTNEKQFPIVSKSQTFELTDQQRNQILKEITNVDKDKQSEACLNCSIF